MNLNARTQQGIGIPRLARRCVAGHPVRMQVKALHGTQRARTECAACVSREPSYRRQGCERGHFPAELRVEVRFAGDLSAFLFVADWRGFFPALRAEAGVSAISALSFRMAKNPLCWPA